MRFHPQLAGLVSVPAAILMAILYVLAGLAGNVLMQSRRPMELTQLKLVYNIAQIVACSVIFYRLLPFFTVRTLLGNQVIMLRAFDSLDCPTES
jgi:hypothetical protein